MNRFVAGGMGVGLIVVDQWTKLWAVRHLSLYSGVPVVGRFLELQLVLNYGAAYGILQNQRVILVATTFAVFACCWVFRKTIVTSRLSAVGMLFILSGAAGNLIDRMQWGYVVDFVNVHWIPVFNCADVFINLGITCFIAEFLWARGSAGA